MFRGSSYTGKRLNTNCTANIGKWYIIDGLHWTFKYQRRLAKERSEATCSVISLLQYQIRVEVTKAKTHDIIVITHFKRQVEVRKKALDIVQTYLIPATHKLTICII